MTRSENHDVIGVRVSTLSCAAIAARLEERRSDRAVVVNVCNVHSVVSARRDRKLARALAEGDINTADGMPLVWFMRSDGVRNVTRANGDAVLRAVIERGLQHGWRHFFYGSTAMTLESMVSNLKRDYPALEVAGTLAPPFTRTFQHAVDEDLEVIRATHPDVVWVGLGMPKQELWMHDVRDRLPGTTLVGIGAVFDFVAGSKPIAPPWMQDHGLEWAFRLASEPRRLWWRYASTNPLFLALWLRHLARRRNAGHE